MIDYKIVRLIDEPEMLDHMAKWFNKKWGVSLALYKESMKDCLKKIDAVPQWYVAIENNRIIGGVGVIENDFHDRKDLAPNICALYVEEDKRCNGIAGALLQYVCNDMKNKGIDTLYLITDHVGFYERYGWKFFDMVKEDGNSNMIRIYIHK